MSALQVHDLHVRLGGREVLERVSLSVAPGELVGLIGPNGAGKTTLMRAVLGLVASDGVVQLGGKVGYVPQRQELDWNYPIGVGELVTSAFVMKREPKRWELAYRALAKVGMYEYRERAIGELSGGQKQRVLIARALAPNPELLLLDEPFTGLDYPNQDALGELVVQLARGGVGVLMATHDLGQALTVCDRLVMLNRTVRAAGEPAALRDPRLWMETYEVGEKSALLASLGMADA